MSILFRRGDGTPVRLEETDFERESLLQKYIYENPETVPLYEIKEDAQLLILAREFPTNSGPIDALAIDSEGDLYIVETKLFKNADKRAVIAQVLDYGAALWKHTEDFSDFLTQLDEHAQKSWEKSLIEKLKEYFSLDGDETSDLLDTVRENLDDGVLRFVVLMDRMDERLRDLVLYVNQNSQFDVYAVQLKCYRHEENEIIIPRVYGAEVKKDIGVRKTGSSRQTRKWTREEILEEAKENLGADEFEAFLKLYDFATNHPDDVNLGTGIKSGFLGAVYEDICPRSVFSLRTNGEVTFHWGWLDRSEKQLAVRMELCNELREHFDIPEAGYEDPHSVLDPEEWVPRVEALMQAITKSIGPYRAQDDGV